MKILYFSVVLLGLYACSNNSGMPHASDDALTLTSRSATEINQSVSSKDQSNSSSSGPPVGLDISYTQSIGNNRFLSVAVIRNGGIIRTLSSNEGVGGAFESEEPARLSPDGSALYLTEIESAELETPHGTVKEERAYCSLINTKNGCIVVRETGEFCGGQFAAGDKWDNSIYPDFEIDRGAPKAVDYSTGRRLPAESPESSFENLLVCDPLTKSNLEAYRFIINNRLFELDFVKNQEILEQVRKRISEMDGAN